MWKNAIKILRIIRTWLLMSWYVRFYKESRLEESWILIDPKNGKDFGGNLLRIAEELLDNPDYKKYRIFISRNPDKKALVRKMAALYGLEKAVFIREGGFRHAKILALAKYLFTDTSFPLWYTKKKGQVVTNTWHGTPLKSMGKDEDSAYDMGNVQKSQMIADYLIYQSGYMEQVMSSAYFLTNLYKGKVLFSGYPRNSVFFEKGLGTGLREKLGLGGWKLYGYMPTWRGVFRHLNPRKAVEETEQYLADIDSKLSEEELLLVRLHPFISHAVDYKHYRHIRPFPQGYEPYDILNICDRLVTDYSSVMFDFANSQKKLILFVYDKEKYLADRGIYVPLDTFPFPQVREVDGLIRELRSPKQYDDRPFLEKYCSYEHEGVAQELCRHIIKEEKVFKEFQMEKNGKENVLVFAGDLSQNGVTTALLSLFSNISLRKRNYYVSFRTHSLEEAPDRVALLPPQVGFLPIASARFESLGEAAASFLYFFLDITWPPVVRRVDRYYKRLYQSNFGHYDFAYAIHYGGYEKTVINLFQQADTKRMIFVHNDMVRELRTKKNQHAPSLKRAYHDYEKVVPVSEDIYEPTLELGGRADNIQVAHNCHDYLSVLEKSRKSLQFDACTACTVSMEKLKAILGSTARKIISIGRFSPEKGHNMLLQAFNRYYRDNPESFLIIIGGYGDLYKQTVSHAASMPAGSHVVIIRSISNPMPILKKCDLLVLPSLYEGLGLVLLEADTLGVPVISTDVPGPQGFMKEHGGYLTPPDAEGIYQGLLAFDKGKITVLNVDYKEFNRQAVQQFEELFSE